MKVGGERVMKDTDVGCMYGSIYMPAQTCGIVGTRTSTYTQAHALSSGLSHGQTATTVTPSTRNPVPAPGSGGRAHRRVEVTSRGRP